MLRPVQHGEDDIHKDLVESTRIVRYLFYDMGADHRDDR